MAYRDVVAVGASAGGVETLRTLVRGLPAGFTAAVLVVLHVPRDSPSALAAILNRAGPLSAAPAANGEPLRPGHIHVAPPDYHLLQLDGRLRLSHGPTENGHRPAIDPLFRSVARAAGPQAVGVVLSGARDDGAAGAVAIAQHGGAVVIQDPEDALYDAMPRAVLAQMTPDRVVAAGELASVLAELIAEPVTARGLGNTDPRLDKEVAMSDFADLTSDQLPASPAGYGCPSCGGSLFTIEDLPVPRYRCRIGHAWSPESLLDEQVLATEGALWTALRALEEKSALSKRMAATRAGLAYGDRYQRMAEEADHAGALIRQLITRVSGQHDQHAG